MSFFRRHGLAFVFALVVGGFSVAPHALAVYAIGSEYRGIPFMPLDDEEVYLARMQEIKDGHPEVGSPFFYEYKDHPTVVPPLGDRLYAFASDKTGLALPQILVVAKFLLPALLFLLVYALIFRMLPQHPQTIRIGGAILGGLLVTLAYDPFSLSVWTRPVNPITGALGLFGCLHLYWFIWKSRDVSIAIITGLLLGFLSFYFFGWALGLAIAGLLLLASALVRDIRRAAGFFLSIIIALAVNTEMLMRFLVGGEGQALAMRNGLLLMHDPLLNKMLLAAVAIFSLATFAIVKGGKAFREIVKEPWWIFCASFLVAGFAVLNQQVLTGKAIWPYHFVQYTKPLSMIVAMVSIFHAIGQRFVKPVLAGSVVLGALIFFQAGVGVRTYESLLPDFRERQQEEPVYSWIRASLPTDAVVLVREEREALAIRIPAFTGANTYLTTWVLSGVTHERAEHNLYVYMRLQNISATDARAFLLDRQYLVRGAFAEDWNTGFDTEEDAWITGRLETMLPRYDEFLKKDFAEELLRYRLDALVTETPLTAEERRAFGIKQSIGEVGRYSVYVF